MLTLKFKAHTCELFDGNCLLGKSEKIDDYIFDSEFYKELREKFEGYSISFETIVNDNEIILINSKSLTKIDHKFEIKIFRNKLINNAINEKLIAKEFYNLKYTEVNVEF